MQPKRIGSKHWALGALLAVCLLTGGGYFLARGASSRRTNAQEGRATPERPAGVHVEVTHPRQGAMDRTTSQPGTIQAFESVHRYAGVSGYLKTQTVDIGDRVKKDQVLATVDVPDLEKKVQQCQAAVDQTNARVKQMAAHIRSANAALQAARAAVPQAEALARSKAAGLRFCEKRLQRYRDLVKLNSIDERLVDEAIEQRDAAREAKISADEGVNSATARVSEMEAKVAQAEADKIEAEAEVKVAQAELEKAQVLVQFATIVAPFDGVVTERNFFPGDFVRAATESGAHLPLVTVQRTDRFRVVVQIPDRDVPYADVDDPAVVEIDALPGQKFAGKVARISDSEDPQTRLMHVEIDLRNPTGKIRHGMYGRVTIILEHSDLLSVPPSCLVGKAEDGKGSVYVVRDGHAHLVPVEYGTDNGLRVAIHKGLQAGDEVILHPGNSISDGTPVYVDVDARAKTTR